MGGIRTCRPVVQLTVSGPGSGLRTTAKPCNPAPRLAQDVLALLEVADIVAERNVGSTLVLVPVLKHLGLDVAAAGSQLRIQCLNLPGQHVGLILEIQIHLKAE